MTFLEKAALQLRRASETRVVCPPVRELIGDTSVENAYQVQFINTDIRVKNGATIIGKK